MIKTLEFIELNKKLIFSAILRHLELTFVSVLIGILIAIPLGIFLSRKKRIAKHVLMLTGVIQTIPGLVLLGLALLIMGIGKTPAIAVLVMYSILPVLRNTYSGITNVDKVYLEAAKGVGMSKLQVLLKVEIPLALPTIIGGIRLSTVYVISWATLAGLIGAGGLGDLIWTGLASYDKNLILIGAVPASLMAIVIGFLMDLLQNTITPRGLKGRV